MKSPIVIESLLGLPISKRRIELVERKGLGHPDMICDSLAEAVAIGLNRMYLKHVGAIAHYNVEKALLVAGQSRVRFGGGEVSRPVQFLVGDRATFPIDRHRLPLEEAAHGAVDAWLARHLARLHRTSRLGSPSRPAPNSSEASSGPTGKRCLPTIRRAPPAMLRRVRRRKPFWPSNSF